MREPKCSEVLTEVVTGGGGPRGRDLWTMLRLLPLPLLDLSITYPTYLFANFRTTFKQNEQPQIPGGFSFVCRFQS